METGSAPSGQGKRDLIRKQPGSRRFALPGPGRVGSVPDAFCKGCQRAGELVGWVGKGVLLLLSKQVNDCACPEY